MAGETTTAVSTSHQERSRPPRRWTRRAIGKDTRVTDGARLGVGPLHRYFFLAAGFAGAAFDAGFAVGFAATFAAGAAGLLAAAFTGAAGLTGALAAGAGFAAGAALAAGTAGFSAFGATFASALAG